MFKIVKNLIRNSIKLESKVVNYQNNFLNQLYDLIDLQLKSISTLMH